MAKTGVYGDPAIETKISLAGSEVVAVKKNGQGDIEKFKLADGRVISYDEAISLVKSNQSHGLILQKGNTGQAVLRSKPDASDDNNLDSLPTFE
jgi:hypothetical protein